MGYVPAWRRGTSMPLWLYDLPNWLFGALIILGWVLFGVLGHELFHRFFKPHFDESDKNLAMALLGVVATINSLLLAFSAVSVWDSFNTANQAVHGEASTINQLAGDLVVFQTVESSVARVELQFYAQTVVAEEWPAMREGRVSDNAWQRFDQTFLAVGRLEPATPREVALMPEIWARANELLKFRRERIDASEGRVPGTLWNVVLLGTILSILPTYVMGRTRFNRFAVALLSLSMGLCFFFIAAMDRPFAGTESIGSDPFVKTLQNMERWDR